MLKLEATGNRNVTDRTGQAGIGRREMTIADLIRQQGALLDPTRTGDIAQALKHKQASITIAGHYRAFEKIRKRLFKGTILPHQLDPVSACIVEEMRAAGLLGKTDDGALRTLTAESRRFVTGGWLEEIACLAAMEAGADEALYGQQIKWQVDGYWGENEIDVIARFGNILSFYSCKAYSAHYRRTSDRSRKKLMEALHEADNLADHFGNKNACVGLILSTDLYDEYARRPKYVALFGKARALNVELITLEDLKWNRLVKAMQLGKNKQVFSDS